MGGTIGAYLAFTVIVSNPVGWGLAGAMVIGAGVGAFVGGYQTNEANALAGGFVAGAAVGTLAGGPSFIMRSAAALASKQQQIEQITFGHGARHLEGSGLSQASVESAIEAAVRATPNAGSHWGWVQVSYGQWIEYRAFVNPDGTINIGTYVCVPANLSNVRFP